MRLEPLVVVEQLLQAPADRTGRLHGPIVDLGVAERSRQDLHVRDEGDERARRDLARHDAMAPVPDHQHEAEKLHEVAKRLHERVDLALPQLHLAVLGVQACELVALVPEALHGADARERLLEARGKVGRDALRGAAKAGQRHTEIARDRRGNNHESDDEHRQAGVQQHHEDRHPDHGDELARDVVQDAPRLVLQDPGVARDAVHEFARAMALEERQRLGVNVGVEPPAQVVRTVQHQLRRDP